MPLPLIPSFKNVWKVKEFEGFEGISLTFGLKDFTCHLMGLNWYVVYLLNMAKGIVICFIGKIYYFFRFLTIYQNLGLRKFWEEIYDI